MYKIFSCQRLINNLKKLEKTAVQPVGLLPISAMPKPSGKRKEKGRRQEEGQEQTFRGNRTSRSSNERERESHLRDKKNFVAPLNVEENTPCDEDQDMDSKYQRRKIESNWDRFKELDDAKILQRGEDFEHLLQSSGGLKSHFQFKEEKEWDEDVTFTSCDFLRIDCSTLRANLETIPLHKRLGISEDVFTPEEIRHFEEVAGDKRSALKRTLDAASERREVGVGPNCDSRSTIPSPDDRITNPSNAVEFNPSVSHQITSKVDPAKSLPADLEDELDRILSLSNNIEQLDQSPSILDHLEHHSTNLEDLLDIDLHLKD